MSCVRRLPASQQSITARVQALDALVAVGDASLETSVADLLGESTPAELRGRALTSLGRLDAPWVPTVVLAHYEKLEGELRPCVIELLTERCRLGRTIARGDRPTTDRRARRSTSIKSGNCSPRIRRSRKRSTVIGACLRTERDPRREEVIAQMRDFLRRTEGNPATGQEVFNRVCGQCHKLFGTGQDVGPDITLNGRNSFEQLLSNVFDPSLVVGAA